MTEPPDFDALELFRALGRHEVTVGGVTIQAYGGQRMTLNLDVTIAASNDNMQRLAAALVDLDARILGLDGQRSSRSRRLRCSRRATSGTSSPLTGRST